MNTILDVKGLSVSFRMYDRGLRQRDVEVVRDLSLSVREGELLAVAGSSGSGKSLLAHAILGILPNNAAVSGEMRYRGEPLTPALQKKLRGDKMELIPQSVEFLDPLMRVGSQVTGGKGRAAFRRYGLDSGVERLYPFQLSGGMARRVLVSAAVTGGAELLIADEPTPGMSRELAETALGHFRALADEGRGVMLITHDLDLALARADRIAVFYAGTVVEIAQAEDFRQGAYRLRHPYSQALWRAIPQNGFQPPKDVPLQSDALPDGCLFARGCPMKTRACDTTPEMRPLRGGEVRCVHAS